MKCGFPKKNRIQYLDRLTYLLIWTPVGLTYLLSLLLTGCLPARQEILPISFFSFHCLINWRTTVLSLITKYKAHIIIGPNETLTLKFDLFTAVMVKTFYTGCFAYHVYTAVFDLKMKIYHTIKNLNLKWWLNYPWVKSSIGCQLSPTSTFALNKV